MDRRPPVELLASDGDADAVRVGGAVVVFAHDAKPLRSVKLAGGGASKCIVLDAVPGAAYRVAGGTVKASAEGVLSIPRLPKGPFVVELR